MADIMKNLILKNLETNGYPDKAVSLPLEKLYEVADKKNENLNTILEELTQEGTIHTKSSDKIIFRKKSSDINLDEDMMKKAQDMMGNMDPAELQKMQEKVASMSDADRENLMKQAKSMGLF